MKKYILWRQSWREKYTYAGKILRVGFIKPNNHLWINGWDEVEDKRALSPKWPCATHIHKIIFP